jgi:acetoin utilization deacetylase AcuC-like enzyme
MVLID